jgi:uncharacterized membrane protein YbhN (UPF0104 family)
MRFIVKVLLLVSASVVSIALMLHFDLVDTVALKSAFNTGLPFLAAAAFCHTAGQATGFVRYRQFLRIYGLPNEIKTVASANFVGTAIGQWLPGSLAVVDALRVGMMFGSQNTPESEPTSKPSLGRLALAGFWDRLMGLSTFFGIGSLLLLFHILQQDAPSPLLVGLAVGSLLLGIQLVFLPWMLSKFSGFEFRNKFIWKVQSLLATPPPSLHSIVQPLLLSLASNLLLTLSYVFCARAIGLSIPFVAAAAALPILGLIGILPLGFGGIGGYQVAAIGLFQIFALEAASVGSASLLQSALALSLNSLTGLIFIQISFHQFRLAFLRVRERL